MIEVSGLYKTYGIRKKVEALKNVSFTVPSGKITALLGPNGAGKSTLLNILSGLIIPEKGEVLIEGISVIKNRRKALNNLSIVMEGDRNLFYRLTGYENVRFYCNMHRIKPVKSEVFETAERFAIAGALNREIRTYSKGMRQKLSLIIALFTPGKVLLLDEPDSGLDLPTVLELISAIREIRDEGKTILLATHRINIADMITDEVIIINNGEIISEGLLDDLKREHSFYICRINATFTEEPDFGEFENDFTNINNEGNNYFLEVKVKDPQRISALLSSLNGKPGSELLDINISQPSLEDVFLATTKSA